MPPAPAKTTRPAAPAPTPRPASPKPAAATPARAPGGPPAIRLGGAPAQGAGVAPGVLELKGMTDFKPPAGIAEVLDASQSSAINARFGNLAQGPIEVKTVSKGKYQIKDQPLSLAHPAFARVAEFAPGLAPALIIKTQGNKLAGEIGLAGGKKIEKIATVIRQKPEMLGLAGFTINNLPTITNTIEGGSLHLGMKGVPIKLGSAFSGNFNFEVIDTSVAFDGNADVKVKGLADGKLELKRTADGQVTGKASVALKLPKSFSGGVDVAWDGVSIIGQGKVGYKGEKFSGEVTLNLMEKNQATQLAEAKKAPEGAAPQAAAAEATKKGVTIEYAVFGEGDLAFAFTEWLNGTAHVIVDPKGNVTVIGKITPQKEFTLFEQKDYVKQLFKLEARASYGIPVVGNIFIFANVGMDLFAKLGPAKFYNIVIEGTYSTDPKVAKNFSIRGSLNISAGAGARLRGEAGAGLAILAHDIKAGAGINGIAGIKAYAEATPVVGYREKGAEGQDLKGEWFMRGDLELAAQPFLGLSGDLFVEIDAPWWSPVPDKKWTWPLGGKEWPLGGTIGMLVSVDYVFGSGQWPKFELKPVEFNSEKFMTNLYEDKAKSGSGKELEQKGKWAEKNSKGADVPKGGGKGNMKEGKLDLQSQAKAKTITGKKSDKDVDRNVQTKDGTVGQLKDKALKKGKKDDSKTAKGAKGETAPKDKVKGNRDEELKKGLAALEAVTAHYAKNGGTKEEVVASVKSVRRQFKVFKSIEVIDGGDTWDYIYTASPDKKEKGPKKSKAPNVTTFVEFHATGNKSGRVFAAPLCEKGEKGSEPVSRADFPVGWPRVSSFDPGHKYWVRMHLLSRLLHGPGNRFENLVPGDKGANSKMVKEYEKDAKDEVLGKGSILWYETRVTYRRGDDFDFAEKINISFGRWTIDPDAPGERAKGKRGETIKSGDLPIDPPGKSGEPFIPVINSNQGYRQFMAVEGITEALAQWLTKNRQFASLTVLKQKMASSNENKIKNKIEILEELIKKDKIRLG